MIGKIKKGKESQKAMKNPINLVGKEEDISLKFASEEVSKRKDIPNVPEP